MPDASPSPLDRILARTDLVTVGAFRCPVDHPLFMNSGAIRQSCVVFPRTAVAIAHDTARPFVADPTLVTLYNTGQQYERRAISPDGDRCDWYAVSTPALRDAVRTLDPAAAEADRRVLRHTRADVDARLYRRQRALFRAIDRGGLDTLAVEETVLGLLRQVLASAFGRQPQPIAPGPRAHRQRVALVDAVRTLVARRFAEPLSLSDISAAVDASPFHLCRAFRAETGQTVHAYRTDLRLRAALERLEDRRGLTAVALDLGFSSHSHFTLSFHRAFGAPPSQMAAARHRPGTLRTPRTPRTPRTLTP